MNDPDARQAEPTYRIGAVSRLAGVAPDTLRVWEWRYDAVVPLRSDADALVKIAAAAVTVRCECPHHLVDLISGLNAFETYSQECEVLKVDDAALHALLHSATAQARSMLETALARVTDADAIEIEDED